MCIARELKRVSYDVTYEEINKTTILLNTQISYQENYVYQAFASLMWALSQYTEADWNECNLVCKADKRKPSFRFQLPHYNMQQSFCSLYNKLMQTREAMNKGFKQGWRIRSWRNDAQFDAVVQKRIEISRQGTFQHPATRDSITLQGPPPNNNNDSKSNNGDGDEDTNDNKQAF